MMKIEILKQGKFTTSGSSVLKMMQNNATPTLDLIVRESIQNSLDASLPNQKNIGVKFLNNTFNVSHFANYFTDIKDNIINKINTPVSKFLSISDFNTIGLVGNLDGNFNVNDKKQNLGKLVFHIMKAQDQEGAGGSWGIGKTVYYRLGIGLVIYYSRIRLDNGEFQQRLVAALVEDETKNDGLLSHYNQNLGVAFFGEDNDGDGCIRAITDDNYICEFLSIFSIKPYSGLQTGTTVIIPFINEDEILENNYIDGNDKAWWERDIENYLRIAILRWYFPRICTNYCYGPKLNAFVNDVPVEADKDSPVFSKLMDLYNTVFSENVPAWINKENILRKTYLKENELGTLVYGKVDQNTLKMLKEHLPSPYKYVLLDVNEDGDRNSPIIAFCRKPGMIVNYEYDGVITSNIKTGKDEYILGLFVLNSQNEIINPVTMNLDEYIRKSEKSDHTSWTDHPIGISCNKIQIVSLINRGIGKILESNYGESKPTSGDSSINLNFANKFGKLLLPDNHFGNQGSKKPSKGEKRSKGVPISRNKKNIIRLESQTFNGNSTFIDFSIELIEQSKSITLVNKINTIYGLIDPCEWENKGLHYPCNISNIALKCEKYDSKNVDDLPVIYSSNEEKLVFKDYKINLLKTATNKCYGVKILCEDFHKIKFVLRFSMETVDKLIQTDFAVVEEDQ